MAQITGISWCDSTANLWIGCTKISAACDNCYAEELMGTEGSRLQKVQWGPHGDRVYCKQGWADLRKWQRQAAANGGLDPKLGRKRVIFINSLSDFFDNHRSVIWRDDAWKLFLECRDLVLILVTKRPQNIPQMLPPFWALICKRVWLLVTTENQIEFDRRFGAACEAFRTRPGPAVIGISAEPLLGPINFGRWALVPDWVIVGGESGKEARPMHPDWLLSLRDQCTELQTPFHFKQWGEFSADQIGPEDARSIHHPPGHVIYNRVGKKAAGRKIGGLTYDDRPAE